VLPPRACVRSRVAEHVVAWLPNVDVEWTLVDHRCPLHLRPSVPKMMILGSADGRAGDGVDQYGSVLDEADTGPVGC
jgi:hypothetical protein